MANIKQTVDLTQGTFNNLVAESGKLKLRSVSAPVFTRNSTATKSDGSVVPVNTPRFESAQNFTYIEDTNAEFRTGTLSNVTALRDLVLSKDGNPDFIKYESTQSDFSTGTLTDVVATADGSLTIKPFYGPDDGSSLSNWTVVGATVDANTGNPKPSFKVTGGQYAYRNVGIGSNMVVEFDFYIITGTYSLCNFYFMCDSNGAGQMFRFDSRSTEHSGFASTTSWTEWEGPTTGSNISAGTWHHFKLVIGNSQAEAFIDNVSFGTYAFTNKGGYIAIHGDASIVTGGYFDNIVIYKSTSGSRTSSVLDISSVKKAQSSVVTWNATAPSGTSIKVETNLSLDGGTTWSGWKEVTNGGSIPDINESTDLSNAKIQYKQTLSTTNLGTTPKLNDFVIEILSDANYNYKTSGYRISPELGIDFDEQPKYSRIEWTADTPSGTNVTVDISWDGGTTWKTCINGGSLPDIDLQDLSSATLKIRENLSTTNFYLTPKLSYLKMEIADKYGKAITMEEGTTNLLKNASFEVGTGSVADGWTTAYNPTVSPSYAVDTSVHRNSGSKSQKISITSSSGLGDVIIYQKISCSANTTYTLSFYAKGSRTGSGVGFIRAETFSSTGTDLGFVPNQSGVEFIPSNDWQRYVLTFTTESNAYYIEFLSGIRAKTAGDTVTIYIDDVQLEQKPYTTSCVFANDTTTQAARSAETLTIPTTNVLNPSEGTIEVWVYVNDSIKQTAENRYIFNAPASTTGFISLYHKASTNSFVLHIKNESGNESSVSISDNDVPNGWHKFTVRWTSSEASLILDDGTKSASVSNPYLPQSFSTNATLGYSGTSGYINTMIDEIRISNKARSDDEIENIYYSQRPMPVDEWTTYLLRFDDNLNYGQGGYYISPEYDVSSVNKAARGKVYWQEDADGIQRIVYAKLDNQADWTQVTNGGLLPISAGDVLTNRKLQLKVKMLKVI